MKLSAARAEVRHQPHDAPAGAPRRELVRRTFGNAIRQFREMGLGGRFRQAVATVNRRVSPRTSSAVLRQVLHSGTPDMFLASVVGVQADGEIPAISTGQAFLSNADPIVYSHENTLR